LQGNIDDTTEDDKLQEIAQEGSLEGALQGNIDDITEDDKLQETAQEGSLEEALQGNTYDITEDDKLQETAEERVEALRRQIELLHTVPNENIYYEYIFCMEMYV